MDYSGRDEKSQVKLYNTLYVFDVWHMSILHLQALFLLKIVQTLELPTREHNYLQKQSS